MKHLAFVAGVLAALACAGRVRHKRMLVALCRDLVGGAQALSEVEFLAFCRRHGLPRPELQVRLDTAGRRRYLDAMFRLTSGRVVRVEIDGVMTGGVLKASKLRIRHVPGTGGPASFSVNGAIGAFSSSASFRVQGQPVNASAPDVVFVNGTAAKLGNGKKVSITGSKVVDGVLIANLVVFE